MRHRGAAAVKPGRSGYLLSETLGIVSRPRLSTLLRLVTDTAALRSRWSRSVPLASIPRRSR